MDNRTQYPRYGKRLDVHADIPGVVLQEGFVMQVVSKWTPQNPSSTHYFFRPDRGSGGFGLYSTAKRAEMQKQGEGETVVKGRLVFIPDSENTGGY